MGSGYLKSLDCGGVAPTTSTGCVGDVLGERSVHCTDEHSFCFRVTIIFSTAESLQLKGKFCIVFREPLFTSLALLWTLPTIRPFAFGKLVFLVSLDDPCRPICAEKGSAWERRSLLLIGNWE